MRCYVGGKLKGGCRAIVGFREVMKEIVLRDLGYRES